MTLVWTQSIFTVRNSQTAPALKDDFLICHLGDKMVSVCPSAQARLVICGSAALAENQWAFGKVISGDVTDIASV